MKTLLNLWLLVIIPFTVFAQPSVNTVNSYLKLKGKIGEKLSVTMDIIKQKEVSGKKQSIQGSYYYDNIGIPIDIGGTMKEDNSFELTEVDTKGGVTGTFKGTIIGKAEMKGVWINPKTKKETPFDLTEVTQNIALFDFEEQSQKYCDYANRNKKSTKKDTLSYYDTLCSEMIIAMIHVKNLKPAACTKINNILLNTLLQMGMGETKYKSINELLHSIDTMEDFFYSDSEYGMSVISNEDNRLCISVSYWANTGGAHPNGYSTYFNFNPQTGDTIMLKDILIAGANDSLAAKAKREFIKANGSLEENDLVMNLNWLIILLLLRVACCFSTIHTKQELMPWVHRSFLFLKRNYTAL